MRALTIRQPWASLIAHGIKTIETRSWATSYRGPVAIHAAKRRPGFMEIGPFLVEPYYEHVQHVDECDCDESGIAPSCAPRATTRMVLTEKERRAAELPLGAVVATATLADCIPIDDDPDRGDHYLMVDADEGELWEYPEGWFHNGGVGDVARHDQFPYGIWTPGWWAWLLTDIRMLPAPVPAKGRQGLWTPDARIVAQLGLEATA